MPELISDVMREEHKRLKTMLAGVILIAGKKKDETQKKFIEFRWNVEKHFFVEEKAIFEAYTDKISVGGREVSLIEEHNTMRDMLEDFGNSLDNGKFPDFSDFRTLMLKHQSNEDDYFYTGLENNLNEDQKAEILDKTKEIIVSP